MGLAGGLAPGGIAWQMLLSKETPASGANPLHPGGCATHAPVGPVHSLVLKHPGLGFGAKGPPPSAALTVPLAAEASVLGVPLEGAPLAPETVAPLPPDMFAPLAAPDAATMLPEAAPDTPLDSPTGLAVCWLLHAVSVSASTRPARRDLRAIASGRLNRLEARMVTLAPS
jgi:hypothetical protein